MSLLACSKSIHSTSTHVTPNSEAAGSQSELNAYISRLGEEEPALAQRIRLDPDDCPDSEIITVTSWTLRASITASAGNVLDTHRVQFGAGGDWTESDPSVRVELVELSPAADFRLLLEGEKFDVRYQPGRAPPTWDCWVVADDSCRPYNDGRGYGTIECADGNRFSHFLELEDSTD